MTFVRPSSRKDWDKMSYRLPEEWKDSHPNFPKSWLGDVAKQSFMTIDNGTITRMTIPCFYSKFLSRYDKMILDHIGWPSSDHPDHSNYRQMFVMHEIDLPEEGYDEVIISMIDPPSGLTISGLLEYNHIQLIITAMCNDAIEEDLYVKFAIYISGTAHDDDNNSIALRDLVTKGILHIIAGSIG